MLKLPKGLKKKKKDKKSKKNQELFTEEELAAYKQREQREKQDAAAAAAAVEPQEASAAHQPHTQATTSAAAGAAAGAAADDADEWRKFAALTSGIDTVLKKTQGNLDRLKESSFYQREPTTREKEEAKRQRDAAAAAAAAAEAKRAALEAAAAEQARKDADPCGEAVVELSESEDESEEADDIFDTTYIDELASRGVDLYVPDTPDEEFDAGPDPFDTDYAEKVIKGPEVSKRGKKLVHIGAAVEVLTGRVDKVAGASVVRRPRRGIQNLLLQSFDDGGGDGGAAEAAAIDLPVQSLLDDIPDDIPGGPIDLSVSLHLQFIKPVEKREEDETQQTTHNLVSEFDVLGVPDEEDEFDEFAELAAESLTAHKDVHVLTEVPVLSSTAGAVEETADWASFQGDNKKAKPPARPPPPKALVEAAVVAAAHIDPSDEFPTPDDEDPFDTTFAERVLPLEDDFDFDPRADEPVTASVPASAVEPINLLDQHIAEQPHLAQPIVVQPSIDQPDIDPFDTSAIAAIVAPKAAEIQLLERELLADHPPPPLPHSLSDEDFDPRGAAAEASPPPPSTADLNRRKSSLSLNIATGAFPLKSVVFAADHLLAVQNAANGAAGAAAGGKIQKPLTPYYAGELVEEKEPDDPFDTSFVPPRKPSQVELTLLERDLLATGPLNRSLSDPDFDPRAITPNVCSGNADLLAVHEEHNIKVLTPAQNASRSLLADDDSSSGAYNDPFDTSAVSQTILPGRAELKIIEDELLPTVAVNPSARISVLDSCSDSQELGLGDKVLTPHIPFSAEQALEEQDPFDTSIANNLAPGQVEIRLLESELIHQ